MSATMTKTKGKAAAAVEPAVQTTELVKEAQGEVLVIPPASTALTPAQFGDADLLEFAGEGNELVTSRDVAMPMLVLLQSTSPQTKRTEAKYLQGAEEGHWLNTLSMELYGPTVEVIDCFFRAQVIAWRDRDKGGGILGIYEPTDPIVVKAKEHPTKRGLLAVEGNPDAAMVPTNQHFVLAKGKDGTWSATVLPFKSTALKVSRRINARLGNILLRDQFGNPIRTKTGGIANAPRYAHVLRLSSVPERNDAGSWWSPGFEIVRKITGDEFLQAKQLRDMCASGLAKVNYDDLVGDGDTTDMSSVHQASAGPDDKAQALDDDIPF